MRCSGRVNTFSATFSSSKIQLKHSQCKKEKYYRSLEVKLQVELNVPDNKFSVDPRYFTLILIKSFFSILFVP